MLNLLDEFDIVPMMPFTNNKTRLKRIGCEIEMGFPASGVRVR